MSDCFNSLQSSCFDDYFPPDSEEYLQTEQDRDDRIKAALQETEACFSSFDNSTSEEEEDDDGDSQVRYDSETQQDSSQLETDLLTSTHTSSPTNGDQDLSSAAWPSACAPSGSTKIVPPTTEAQLLSAVPPRQEMMASARSNAWVLQHSSKNTGVHCDGGDQSMQYKVQYKKHALDTLEEEQFYLENENVEFLHIGEAETANENQRHCQQLLQQLKADNSETCGKIRVLEAQVSSLRDAKEELIRKLQTAESTIENQTHHIEELQESESLSRARNEHEAVITSLTKRHEREVFHMKEKLDDYKRSLEVKQEEFAAGKKQLAEMARELELVQLSKADTVNKLTRSLEESQRQCQGILEQSSSPEVSMLRVQLQQAIASRKASEDLCQNFQREITGLKEQLNMFESASRLGVFTSSASSASKSSHNDSIFDLGMKKTLNFDSPQTVARQDGTLASDKMIASLKSELERCLSSNRQQRLELTDRIQQVKDLQEELQTLRSRVASLEKTCADQKVRLQELDSVNKPGGVGAVEARLQREIEDFKRDRKALLADFEDCKTRLREVGDNEAKLTEINAELKHQIAQMVHDYDNDKQSALESCQRTMEAVHRQSFDKLRQDIEERFQSEKTMLMNDSKSKLDDLNQKLRSSQAEVDHLKSLYVKTCEEHSQREVQLEKSYRTQLEEELRKMTDRLEKEKREWESFMRDQMAKEQGEFKNSFRRMIEFTEESHSNGKMTGSQDSLAGAEQQQLVRHAEIEEALSNAKKTWQKERERDIQHWMEERKDYESKLASKDSRLQECNQKLELAVKEKESLQKLAEDSALNHETNVKSMETRHKEEIKDIMLKYDRQIQQAEEKLAEMYQQFASSCDNKFTSSANILESFKFSDLLGKLNVLKNIVNEKDVQLQDLRKILQEQKAALMLGVSKNNINLNDSNGSLIELEYSVSDLSEASTEKLKEHVKNLESILYTMKQKHTKEVSEMKQQHQKEFENASKLREDKFQAELRYFLKEKEDQCKTRIDAAVEQYKNLATLQQEQVLKEADEKQKCVMRDTICEFENKIAELQKIIDDYKSRFNNEIQPNESKSADKTSSLSDKMKREISILEEKYNTEKSTLERKMKQLEEEKDDEIVNLCLRQAEDERKLKEQLNSDLASLKAEHQNLVKQLEQELSLQKSDTSKAQELVVLLKNEIESNKLVVEELKKEVEDMKGKLTNTQSLTNQRKQWFLEAQEYINKEIKQGVDDVLKREGKGMKEKLEKIKQEEKQLKEKLDNIMEEERKIKEKWAKINKEQEKVGQKWQKILEVEEKIKNDQEETREKNQEKFEKKAEMRRILQEELDKLNQKFVVELNGRVATVKTQLEQQKIAWQEEERNKLVGEREKIVQALRSHMERSLQEAKVQLEVKMEKIKENELKEIRNQMQLEMRKRIQSMREEWEHEREDHIDTAELNRLKECLQAETDARIKACQEKDKAIDHLKHCELQFREEEQRLMLGLKQCQEDMDEASKRHEAVAEQVNSIDRKYKQNLKKFKASKSQELAELKAKHAEEKDSLLALLRTHYEGDLEKVRKQAEQEKATLVLELERLTEFCSLAAKIPQPDPRIKSYMKSQDQHLDPADPSTEKMSRHFSGHTLMPAPVIGKEIIDSFKVKVKTYIRSALSQEVPESSIIDLEQSLDVLWEHMKSMAAGISRPDSSKYSSSIQKLADDDVVRNKQTKTQTVSNVVSDWHLPQHHCSQNNHKELLVEQRWHPRPDKVDQRDFDRHQLTSSVVKGTSPADQAYTRAVVTPTSMKPNSPMSYLSAHTRTIPTKLEAVYNKENTSGFSSARDERKFVEARVRLVNWAQTGEMPWKTSREVSHSQPHDVDSFIKPGLDAGHRMGQLRTNSHFLTINSKHPEVTKQNPRYYTRSWVPSESDFECSVSSDAPTSFVTLKSDVTD